MIADGRLSAPRARDPASAELHRPGIGLVKRQGARSQQNSAKIQVCDGKIAGQNTLRPSERMTSDQNPAGSHLRMMELRIEQQVELIDRLKQAGEDTSEAVRRLALLQHALGEMRVQLGQLSPTERDNKRPDKTRSTPARPLS